MKNLRGRLLREEHGFTLVEMLVTMVMMVTVLFALYSIFDMGIRVFSFGNDKTEAAENARIGLGKMEREIRAAYPQGDGSLLSVWEPHRISFQNRTGSGPPQPVTYSLSGGCSPPANGSRTLLRNTTVSPSCSSGGDPVVEYVDGVDGLQFTYCKSVTDCSSQITDEKQIMLVRITLKIKKPGLQAGTQTLTTNVYLRNRQ